ncbi:hypothetical protein BDW22DRAFT_1463099, partial [Trametopsis cervina]
MSWPAPSGVTDLPIIGTKGAPEKFKGKDSKVEGFLRHYERLCSKYHIVSDQDKVEGITQYCSTFVRELMENLPSYINPNWSQFASDIKKYFDADQDARKFKTRDLEKYVEHSRKKSAFQDMTAWMKYQRGFMRIAGWLEKKKKITSDDKAFYFWKGIPKQFRHRIESRLMSGSTPLDLDKPFPISDISRIAEVLLKRDRFDKDRLPSDSEESDSEQSSSEDSSDEDESNSDSEEEKRSKRAKAHKKKSKTKK